MMPALVVWLLLAAAADRPIGTQLVASNVAVIPQPDGYPAVEFDLTNGTGKTVTAWLVQWRLEFSDGSVETKGYGVDDYPTYAGARQVTRFDPENVHVVPPHASIRTGHFEPDRHGGLSRATILGVSYAIFDDGSWIGDERSALDTFKRRGTEAAALAYIVSALQAADAIASGTDALRDALARLNDRTQPDFDAAAKQVMRGNLQMLLDGRIKDSPRVALQEWIDSWGRRQRAAEQARVPR